MAEESKKEKMSPLFQMGNFSSDLRNDVPNKGDFVEMYKGKLNVDVASVHAALKAAKIAYNKDHKITGSKAKAKEETAEES